MRELTIDEIRSKSLEILQIFHDFCTANGITYFMGCGTLLGAIRHGGFIPWDDDIDVIMPRQDFDRLCSLYRATEKTALFYPGDGKAFIPFGRLCDMKDTLVTSPAPWCKTPTGVWIDIFPLDGAPDDSTLVPGLSARAKAYMLELRNRRFIYGRKFSRSLRGRLSYLLNAAKGRTNVLKYPLEFDAFCRQIPYGATRHCMIACSPTTGVVSYFKLADFQQGLLHKFEDREFMVPAGYDSVLTDHYHDYMTLPPVEKQVLGHGEHRFYLR